MLVAGVRNRILALGVFLCLGALSFSFLGAVRDDDLMGYFAARDRISALDNLTNKIKEIKAQRDTLEVQLRAKFKQQSKTYKDTQDADLPQTALEAFYKQDSEWINYTQQLKKLNKSGGFGSMFEQGFAARTAKTLAEVFDAPIKNAGERLVVPLVGSLVDWLLFSWQKGISVLFHGSKEPFTKLELERWSNIIFNDMEGFGLLIKGREAMDSRAKDLTGRAFDSEEEGTVNQDLLLNKLIIARYAEQFENYACAIENRVGYYKRDSEVVFIAGQIVKSLREFKDIILSITSIKDVAAKIGQNIAVITETKKNTKNLFDELIHAAIPNSYLEPKKRPSLSDGQQRTSYPMSYGNGYGDSDWLS